MPQEAHETAGSTRSSGRVVTGINDFWNTYVAHQEKELTDAGLAEKELRSWINGLKTCLKTLSSAN